jgi:pimeloyl-ACP methyl ester carboxylesterase
VTTWVSAGCTRNGIAIHYRRTGGDKPPLVLLHGLTGSGACWTPVARLLAADHDVVMPDARGHGGSSAPPHGYRYDDHASDVVGLIEALTLSRPILVGHSMGGMTAAVAASRAGAMLRGVVLVDPTFLGPARQLEVRDSDVAARHLRDLGRTRSELVAETRARHPHRSVEILELLAEARLHTSPAAFEVLTPPLPDYRDILGRIDVPTLLVVGDGSPVLTLEQAIDLRAVNSRLRVDQVPGAGHGVPYDQPERLARVIAAFARGLP